MPGAMSWEVPWDTPRRSSEVPSPSPCSPVAGMPWPTPATSSPASSRSPSRSRPAHPTADELARAQRLTRPSAHQRRDRCRHRRSARRPVPGWRRGSRGPGHHVGRGPGVHRRRAPTDHRLHPEDPFGAGHHRCPDAESTMKTTVVAGAPGEVVLVAGVTPCWRPGPGTRPPSWAVPVSVTSPLRSLRPHPLVRSPSVSTPRMPRAHRSRPRGTRR